MIIIMDKLLSINTKSFFVVGEILDFIINIIEQHTWMELISVDGREGNVK